QVLADCMPSEEGIGKLESAFTAIDAQLAAINKEALPDEREFERLQQEVKQQEQLLDETSAAIHHRLSERFEAKKNQWASLRDQAKTLGLDIAAAERALEKISL